MNHSKTWANRIKGQHHRICKTAREIEIEADISTGNICHFENGQVPKPTTVILLALVLGADVDEALVSAGYAPSNVPASAFLSNDSPEVPKVLRGRINELAQLPAHRQREVAVFLSSVMAGVLAARV